MMQEFLRQFFEYEKAEITELPAKWTVRLTEPLQKHFGQDTLKLVFDAQDVDESSELVTPGSYVPTAIHGYLQSTGGKIISRLEERFSPTREALVKSIKVSNGQVKSIKSKKIKSVDVLFNFKITYLSDEKTEEILSLGIDQHNHVFDSEAYYTKELIQSSLTSLQHKGAIDFSSHEVELAFRACLKEASARAQSRGEALQKDILKRLHRNISRIKGYYTAQIEELHRGQPSYEEKRISTEREFQHKLKEEIDNHRLRIVLKLVSFHVIERSEIEISARIAHKKNVSEIDFPIIYDSYSGELDYGYCPACKHATGSPILLDNGKVGCSRCVFECTHCHNQFADEAHAFHCSVCEDILCKDCVITCSDCKKHACSKHSQACVVGSELVCTACQKQCSVCSDVMCSEHTFECFATKAPVCHTHRVICKQCRRVYSSGYVSSLKKSGQFCPECKTPFTEK